jgi:hypothetical protein
MSVLVTSAFRIFLAMTRHQNLEMPQISSSQYVVAFKILSANTLQFLSQCSGYQVGSLDGFETFQPSGYLNLRLTPSNIISSFRYGFDSVL